MIKKFEDIKIGEVFKFKHYPGNGDYYVGIKLTSNNSPDVLLYPSLKFISVVDGLRQVEILNQELILQYKKVK